MPRVHNWQLGREMDYPYDAHRPRRQFAAVFNINRCIGCQTCTMACKSTWTFGKGQEAMWWNNVETKPYGGYPQAWDAQTLALLGPQPGWNPTGANGDNPYGVYQGKTLFEAAALRADASGQQAVGYLPPEQEWTAPNINEDTANRYTPEGTSLPVHSSFFFYLQRICNHCTYPACLAACPRKAIYKRPVVGIVLIDQGRCRGYRKCIEACPYKKPMFRSTTGVSEKCIACYPRLEGKDPLLQGLPMVTRCIAVCVGKIRLQGFIDDPRSPVHWLVKVAKVALPLYPQFGTEPNVYYIPPRWAPRPYLRQMFGPGVETAIEGYMNPSKELLAILQLFGATQQLIEGWGLEGEEVVGLDGNGKEIVRVPLEDPVIVRPEVHHNIT